MITIKDILRARRRIVSYIYQTPLEKSYNLSSLIEGEVFLKLECQQLVKAYKIRGAYSKLLKLSPHERQKGVMAVSSGNHGACISFAASILGLNNVHIYVPEVTPEIKKEKIKRYGAHLTVKGKNYDESHQLALMACKEYGYTWIDSCSDEDVIAGQGTIGLELMQELPDLDAIVVPIGGGGIITGISIAVKAINPAVEVIGVQTEACPAMLVSMKDNVFYETYPTKPSICEALVGGVGEIPFKLSKQCIDEILIVSEDNIKRAVVELIKHDKVLAEPSAAVGVASLLEYPDRFRNMRVGVVITGGNIDFALLQQLLGGCN